MEWNDPYRLDVEPRAPEWAEWYLVDTHIRISGCSEEHNGLWKVVQRTPTANGPRLVIERVTDKNQKNQ